MDIQQIVSAQKELFKSGKTLTQDYRRQRLEKLRDIIESNLDLIHEALKEDLNKPLFEAFTAETMFVINEINKFLKNLNKWMKPRKVASPKVHLPVKCFIKPEPFGTVFIISPWNYPFQLLISPLVGALAAGNTVIVKPSELAPNVSKVIYKLISENFPVEEIAVIEGGPDETNAVIDSNVDYIFYTGSTNVGRIIYQRAAKFLTPVTLELGGKSPCVIQDTKNLDLITKRIVWGKFMNAGQTCIAPDYILMPESYRDKVVDSFKKHVKAFYGEDPSKSKDYSRIISRRHYERLKGFLEQVKVHSGGNTNDESLYIEPTLVECQDSSPLLQEEIFGPILPIVFSESLDHSIEYIKNRPKPLALYSFSDSQSNHDKIVELTSSGGVCLNDTLLQITSDHLPFGGVGESGIGAYHGKFSFDTFSHQKSIMKRTFKFDVPLRYPPFPKKLNLIKFLLKNLG